MTSITTEVWQGFWDQDTSDQSLTDAARAGDVSAFQELYVRHRDVARRVARRCVEESDAEDLVAESFAAVFSAMRKGLGPTEGFRAYLLSSLRRLATRWSTTGARQIPVGDMWLLDDADQPGALASAEDEAVDIEAHGIVRSVFGGLSDKARSVLWCVDVEGLSYAAAGRLLGLSDRSVKSAIGRARRDLQLGYVSAQINGAPHASQDRAAGSRHPSSRELARYATGRASASGAATIDSHVDVCVACRLRLEDARSVGSSLKGLMIPGLLAPLVWPRRLAPATPTLSPLLSAVTAIHPAVVGVVGTALVGALVWGGGSLWNADGATGPTGAVGGVAISAPSASASSNAAPGGVHAEWDASASVVGVPLGSSSELTFRVWSDDVATSGGATGAGSGAAPEASLSLRFTLPDSLELTGPYPECSQSGRELSCPLIGALDGGDSFDGVLTVTRVGDGEELPTVEVSPR